ncbi:hypothetical protein QTI66_02440 [Variovorax sp. J22R133]|uniref:hypothetical protein n=1 Tax=Variovorax brevis TaxID=3053503 RepID=UPI0025762916|nr:hypothetical protein [Variovorax sp. J22R133]MDM0110985.1 hypothetical protein [Variovorax sp. J22R133]
MRTFSRLRPTVARCVFLAATLGPCLASAQSTQADTGTGNWRYSLSVYGYFPSIGGSSSVPSTPGGPTIDVNAGTVIDSLKFTFMGAFEAHNGRWGVFTDYIYLDLGGSKYGTRDFTIGGNAIPLSTQADLTWDLKGSLWTLGGEYRVMQTPALSIDLLAGARMFALKPSLRWGISGDLGPIAPAGRSGSFENSETLWDGIAGLKGRYTMGETRRWSFPFYADVGTGQSRLTWQAAAGVSYAYPWGELTAMWRYISYDMKSGSTIDNLNFNGPMLGATFRW